MRFGVILLLHLVFLKGFGYQDIRPKDSINVWLSEVTTNQYLTKEKKDFYLEKALRELTKSNPSSLNKVSSAALKNKDSILFRKFNKKVIQLATDLNQSQVNAFAHWDLADFFKKSTPDSSFYHYQEAYTIFMSMNLDSTNNHYPGRLLIAIGSLQDNIKDYVGAEKSHIEAIRYFENIGRIDKLYSGYNSLGIAQNGLRKFDKAIEYQNKAREYISEIPVKKQFNAYAVNENNIASAHLRKGAFKEAFELYSILEKKDSLLRKYPLLYAKMLSSKAFSAFKSGQQEYEVFNQAFERSNFILDSIDNNDDQARNFEFFAQVLAKQGDTLNAIGKAQTAKKIAKQSLNNDRVLSSLNLLGTLDKKNSSKYFNEYAALNDRLHQKERSIQDKFARLRMETDEILEENEKLAKQKELYAGIALILLVLGLGIFTIISQRINNQKLKFKQKQQNTNQEIYNLMLSQHGKLEEGKKSEKKRISEELHDGILGQMLGIRLVLSGLNDRTDQEAIEQRTELIQKLQELEEEVRTISHELNASAYEKVHNFIVSIQEPIRPYKRIF